MIVTNLFALIGSFSFPVHDYLPLGNHDLRSSPCP
jgi:hypothetical protein